MNYETYDLDMYVDCVSDYFDDGDVIYVDSIGYLLDDIEDGGVDVVEQDVTQMEFLIDAYSDDSFIEM